MGNRFTFASLLLALVIATCPLSAAEKRTYNCYPIQTPPKIDGLLDDEAWRALPASDSFTVLTTAEYAEKQTYIKLGWDIKNLYVAVRCDEPDMKLLSANMGDGDAIWGEDSIEIFLQPEPSAGYFQFAINSLGAKAGVERASGLLNFDAKGHHGPDFYTLEVRLPFSIFGGTPKPGEVWRGNIDRNVWAGGKVYSCWAPLQGSFHDTANFGQFIFEHRIPAPELAGAPDASDQQYRAVLVERINTLVKKAQEYEPFLVRGLESPAYRTEAQQLMKRAAEFRTLQATIPTAAIKDLAAGARSHEEFFVKLHEFKYRLLITKLLEEPKVETRNK
jgi:hypothetical protein